MSWPLSGGFLVEHGGYPNVGNPMNRRQGDYQDPLPIWDPAPQMQSESVVILWKESTGVYCVRVTAPHLCIWGEAGHQNISLGHGWPSLAWRISVLHLSPSRNPRSPFKLIPLTAPCSGILPVSLPDVLSQMNSFISCAQAWPFLTLSYIFLVQQPLSFAGASAWSLLYPCQVCWSLQKSSIEGDLGIFRLKREVDNDSE